MVLVMGGCFQGKTAYALNLFGIDKSDVADGMNCSLDRIYSAKLFYHFHEYIKRLMQEDREFSLAELLKRNPDIVIVTNELGYGIVPVDQFDREYREKTGRICCQLAKEAKEVHRVVCGLGMVIKHE